MFVSSAGTSGRTGRRRRLGRRGRGSRACTRSSTASPWRSRRRARRAVSPAAAASPARYSSGMKWSGVGHGQRRSRRARCEPRRRSAGARVMISAGVVVEACGPSRSRRRAALQSMRPQVVHDVAAADDQHAALAQRAPARRRARGGSRTACVGVDRQLHDGDVGVGEGVHEHRPGAVVDAPAVVVEADPRRLRRARRSPRPARGRPGAGYSHREQLVGEAVEVVDRPRLRPSPSRRWR